MARILFVCSINMFCIHIPTYVRHGYGIIDLSTHRNEFWNDYICIHCNELSVGIQIDEMILPTISELNKKGYETKFCCSGHSLDGNPELDVVNNFYIYFKIGC